MSGRPTHRAAAEAGVLGRGGITIVSRVTRVSRRAIAAGLAELRSRTARPEGESAGPVGGDDGGSSTMPPWNMTLKD